MVSDNKIYVAVVGELTTGFKFVGPLTYKETMEINFDEETAVTELISLQDYYKSCGEEEDEDVNEKQK